VFGPSRGGVRTGALGDAAVLSFGRSKAVGGPGEGGAVVTRDGELGYRLGLFANHGSRDGDHLVVVGST
jgi:dTDP-4-amino-4,6-dideoxygalactose transaminase